jgi:flavorubredoxin
MNKETLLYEDGVHKCVMFSLEDEDQAENSLSVNQFLIIQGDSAIVIDPGSGSIFSELYEAIGRHIDPLKIKYIFFSHQDPDVAGAIAEWSVATSAKLIISGLWTRFMSHYGLTDSSRIIALPDHGGRIPFKEGYVQFIPAHFLHSPGNFSLYDSRSKIVFSGDIGAAILSPQNLNKQVDDFESHRPFLESFHQRYMAANAFCRAWVREVKRYEVEMIAPQHGSLFRGPDAAAFLEWFENVEGGLEHLDDIYLAQIE